MLGKADAPITIVEYASMTCPHCAHFDKDVLPDLKKKWIETGKAKLVLRDYPLDEVALRAAMMARCAPPERFYPLVDTLFETQEQWALAKDWRGALEKTARLAGIGAGRRAAPVSPRGIPWTVDAICFDVSYDDAISEQVRGLQVLTVQTSERVLHPHRPGLRSSSR